jgi:peptidoglycan/LPS O-acetylase OafA/YrhL
VSKGGGLYIASLDGIRAAAVTLVFVSHAGLNDKVPGNFGVTAFFFLSGYLITTLLRLEHEQSGAISFRAFYLRRVLRIFPPFYLALAAATVLWLVGGLPNGPAFRLDGTCTAGGPAWRRARGSSGPSRSRSTSTWRSRSCTCCCCGSCPTGTARR